MTENTESRGADQEEIGNPIFIVGMNGSGTTMLLDCISHHPDLYAFPKETRIIPFLIARAASLGDLDADENFRKLWGVVLGQKIFEYENGDMRISPPDNWRSYPRNLESVLNWTFAYFAGKEGKSRWCEKSPHNIQHISQISSLFPGAQFIHVIRDGRDCAASFHRRWMRTPALTIHRWKMVLREGRRQGSSMGPGLYLEVKYEELTTDTERCLRAICEFLHTPYNKAILQSNQPYLEGWVGGNSVARAGELVPNSEKWRTYFSEKNIVVLESIGGKTLGDFGYETEQPNADRNLSPLKVRWLSTRDSIVQYAREIFLKVTGRIGRPWRVILLRPFQSIRHRKYNRF
ncbi:MAG: sulfotransferase [candidate division Zixibacteria bacterium]